MEIIKAFNRKYYGQTGFRDAIISRFSSEGINVRLCGNVYNISSDANTFIPRGNWRSLGNMVLEISDSKITPIAVGAPPVYPVSNLKEVLGPLEKNKYDIYPITFGTVIYLYYYGGRWMMGSRRSADVKEITWRDKTFGEAYHEAASKYDDFSTLDLDIKRTYSFVLYHRDVHLYGSPDEATKLVYICSRDNSTGEIRYDDRLKCDIQRPIENITLSEMFDNMSNSIEVEQSKRIMGYVLREKKTGTTREPHIVIKSAAYIALDNMIGQGSSFSDVAIDIHLSNIKALKEFKALFPDRLELLKRIDDKYDDIIDHIVDKNEVDPTYVKLRSRLLTTGSFLLKGSMSRKIVKDILKDKSNSDVHTQVKAIVKESLKED
jgi:hypothetical protein